MTTHAPHPISFPTGWILLLGSLLSLQAEEIYFGRTTSAEVADALVRDHPHAVSAEGTKLRVLSGPGLADSASPGGLRLIQAGLSPITASPLGYASHVDHALTGAAQTLRDAATYRYSHGQGGENALWNIQFEGVPPKTTPTEPNFFPEKIDEAMASARAALRANPYRTGPGSGYALLFQAAYEATVPHTWSGNEWRAKAEKDRLGLEAGGADQASIDTRLASLQNACDRYRRACQAFLAFLNHEAESAWLLDPESVIGDDAPSWMPPVIVEEEPQQRWTWAALLYQAYVEAVAQFAQSQFERLYTRYLKDYEAGGHNALLDEIQRHASEIDRLMLPVSALKAADVLDPEIDTGTPASYSALLRRLADHVVERSLFFSPGVNPLSGSIAYSTYGPNHVPFLVPAQLASRPFSFDNFLSFTFGIDGADVPVTDPEASPNSLIGIAIVADAAATNAVDQVLQRIEDLNTLRDQTQSEYETQLKQLCGQRLVDPGNSSVTVPDILGYLLPTEDREPLLPTESFGDIALQWNKIEQAETRLLSAYRALAEIDEEAQIIRDYGNERLLSYDRIAKIQLNTGEQISALDYLSGEIRANAILAEAEERAKQAEKKSWFRSASKWAAHGFAAIATGGATLTVSLAFEAATDLGAAIDQHRAAKSMAEMHRNIGRIQADATRRQAEIQVQQTRIRAMEGAQITMEQAGQEENRIREAIQKLMIRVERQKLEILFAQQQLDFAELEHANVIGRISHLLEEYRRVTLRNANSTLNRPDVRLHRDYQIQEAARTFRVAQEYAFLCARAARYRFVGPNLTYQNQINAVESAILKAQNGEQLEQLVGELIEIRGQFLASINGLPPVREVRFSLRDLVAQSNHPQAVEYRNPDGTWKEGLVTSFLQGFPGEGGAEDLWQDLSDEQFVSYLEKHLESDGTGSSYLRLRFPIGFEKTYEDRVNPLRAETTGQFGHVIVGPGPSYVHGGAVGVFVNIRNRSISPVSLPASATLRPVGTFYTTTGPHGSATTPVEWASLRVWNPVEKQGVGGSASVKVLYNRDTVILGWASRFSADLATGSGGFQLHERSPANDHWLLEIEATGGKETGTWGNLLPNIRDIEICMTIQGWTSPN